MKLSDDAVCVNCGHVLSAVTPSDWNFIVMHDCPECGAFHWRQDVVDDDEVEGCR